MKKNKLMDLVNFSLNFLCLFSVINLSNAWAGMPAVEYKIISMREDTFEVSITIPNREPGSGNWQLEFDLMQNIESVWNAELRSQTGDHYVVKSSDSETRGSNGQSVNFWFIAHTDPGNSIVPSNCMVNSERCIFSIIETQGVRYGRL
ncbi:MAG: cellulose binding domain-containing protein [Bdellovibrionia bacterium]